jgi:hypothetical protein
MNDGVHQVLERLVFQGITNFLCRSGGVFPSLGVDFSVGQQDGFPGIRDLCTNGRVQIRNQYGILKQSRQKALAFGKFETKWIGCDTQQEGSQRVTRRIGKINIEKGIPQLKQTLKVRLNKIFAAIECL